MYGVKALMWGDFAQLLRRNANPASQLRFYPPLTNGPTLICTIMDYNLPWRWYDKPWERDPDILEGVGGYDERAMEVDSVVVNGMWDEGWIPMKGKAFGQRKIRGVKSVIDAMLRVGCLIPSDEIQCYVPEALEKVPGKFGWLRLLR